MSACISLSKSSIGIGNFAAISLVGTSNLKSAWQNLDLTRGGPMVLRLVVSNRTSTSRVYRLLEFNVLEENETEIC